MQPQAVLSGCLCWRGGGRQQEGAARGALHRERRSLRRAHHVLIRCAEFAEASDNLSKVDCPTFAMPRFASLVAACRSRAQRSATSPSSRRHRHRLAPKVLCLRAAHPARPWRGGAAAAVALEQTPMQPAPQAAAAAAGRGCGGGRGVSSGRRRRSGWGAAGGGSSRGRQSDWTWRLRLPTAGGSGGCETHWLVRAPSPHLTAAPKEAAVMRAAAAAAAVECLGGVAAAAEAVDVGAATTTWRICFVASSR